MANQVIKIVVNTNANTYAKQIVPIAGNSQITYKRLRGMFRRLQTGAFNSNLNIVTGGTAASGTITLSSFVNTNTITINGLVLTGATSPSGVLQFKIGTTDTITAQNAVACINAHPSTGCDVNATSSGAVITITAVNPGIAGNLYTIAISANGSVSGATLTGGVAVTSASLQYGRVEHGIAATTN